MSMSVFRKNARCSQSEEPGRELHSCGTQLCRKRTAVIYIYIYNIYIYIMVLQFALRDQVTRHARQRTTACATHTLRPSITSQVCGFRKTTKTTPAENWDLPRRAGKGPRAGQGQGPRGNGTKTEARTRGQTGPRARTHAHIEVALGQAQSLTMGTHVLIHMPK